MFPPKIALVCSLIVPYRAARTPRQPKPSIPPRKGLPGCAGRAGDRGKFRFPKAKTRLREPREGAFWIGMTVPKAPMHENHAPKTRKNKVRLAGQVFSMQPKPIPHSVDKVSDGQFGGRIFPADAPHPVASLLGRKGVRHSRSVGRTGTTRQGQTPLRRRLSDMGQCPHVALPMESPCRRRLAGSRSRAARPEGVALTRPGGGGPPYATMSRPERPLFVVA
jgi:hypothetical protein